MTAYMEHKNLANETIDAARAGEIAGNVHAVLDRVAAAEQAAGRKEGSVRLLAATKTRDVGEIMAAIDAGIRMIGENRPQEVQVKAPGLLRLAAERGFALGVGGDATADASNAAASDAAASNTAAATNGMIPFHLKRSEN